MSTTNGHAIYKAPFPYFGGKSRIAPQVWARFGDVRGYIEPFFGSGAVLLGRPQPFEGTETVNDMDGMICNAWRAIKRDPAKVAKYADNPVFENDCHARHVWLVERIDTLQAKLEGDPEFYDAKAAGYWLHGIACWIGSGFCCTKGPWGIVVKDGVRQLVHLGNAGQGVNRQLVHLSDAGQAGLGECGLLAWMEALANRFARVRVCCGDWRRVCGGKSGDALQHFFSGGEPCGVFLDPPYPSEADRDMTLYRKECGVVAHACHEWALEHGDDPRLRIAFCGYEGSHSFPRGWRCVKWKAKGGMASVSKNGSQAQENCHRERLWFSPHCISVRSREAVAA